MWAYKVIRLTEQPRTLHSGKWAGLVLDSCSWEWWPYVSLATGLVFWLRSFICGNTRLRSEGWCCKFKITWSCIGFTWVWVGSAGGCVTAASGTESVLSHWTFPFHQRATTIRKRGRIVSSPNQQNCIWILPVKVLCFFFLIALVMWHVSRQGSWSSYVPAPVCAQRKGIFFCPHASVSLFPSWSDSSTYLVCFVITENASYCA